MTIKKEIELKDFEAWGGAVETLRKLTDEEIKQVEAAFEEQEIECTETELNDYLWFETDDICELLGISEEEWDAR